MSVNYLFIVFSYFFVLLYSFFLFLGVLYIFGLLILWLHQLYASLSLVVSILVLNFSENKFSDLSLWAFSVLYKKPFSI